MTFKNNSLPSHSFSKDQKIENIENSFHLKGKIVSFHISLSSLSKELKVNRINYFQVISTKNYKVSSTINKYFSIFFLHFFFKRTHHSEHHYWTWLGHRIMERKSNRFLRRSYGMSSDRKKIGRMDWEESKLWVFLRR